MAVLKPIKILDNCLYTSYIDLTDGFSIPNTLNILVDKSSGHASISNKILNKSILTNSLVIGSINLTGSTHYSTIIGLPTLSDIDNENVIIGKGFSESIEINGNNLRSICIGGGELERTPYSIVISSTSDIKNISDKNYPYAVNIGRIITEGVSRSVSIGDISSKFESVALGVKKEIESYYPLDGLVTIGDNAHNEIQQSVVIGRNSSSATFNSFLDYVGDIDNLREEAYFNNLVGEVVIGSNSTINSHGIVIGSNCSTIGMNESRYFDYDININSGMSTDGTAIGHPIVEGYDVVIGADNKNNGLVIDSSGNIETVSDRRDKVDFKAIERSLEFINQLKPVTFRENLRSKYDLNNEDEYQDYLAGIKSGKRRIPGFKAQDVYQTLIDIYKSDNYAKVVSQSLYDYPDAEIDQFTMSYDAITPFLVGALKEQTEKLSNLIKTNNGLFARLQELEKEKYIK